MKRLVLFFTVLNSFIAIGQDVIILKSNVKYLVKIQNIYNDSIHYRLLSDTTNQIRNINRRYVDSYFYERELVSFPYDPETGSITYTDVVKVPEKTKDQIYFLGKSFIVDYFKSAQDVIQQDDKENGQLIAKGCFKMCISMGFSSWGNCDQYVRFTLSIQVKDGRYKYKIYNFNHESLSSKNGSGGALENIKPECGTFLLSQNRWKEIQEQSVVKINALIYSMNESIVNSKTPKEDNSW